MFEIRPFREEDRAAINAIRNRDLPPVRQLTAADWQRRDAERSPREVALRLVAGDPAIAYLEVTDLSTATYREDGACEIELIVAHEQRRRGIGANLYARGIAFARERHAHTLKAWVYQYSDDEPAPRFLRQRGFVDYQRRQTSHLDLAAFVANRFVELVAAVERQGVRIISYADLPDTPEQRQRLAELYRPFYTDYTQAPAEEIVASDLDHANWETDTLLLAEMDGAWVALTWLALYNPETGAARIPFTGTLPDYRGRGIAAALKVRGAQWLQARGGRVILTSNRVENAPILAINRRLGFIPGPLELTYSLALAAPRDDNAE